MTDTQPFAGVGGAVPRALERARCRPAAADDRRALAGGREAHPPAAEEIRGIAAQPGIAMTAILEARGYEEIEARAASVYEHWVGSEGLSFRGRDDGSGDSATSSSSTGRRSPRTARCSQSGSASSSSPRTAGSSATTRSSSLVMSAYRPVRNDHPLRVMSPPPRRYHCPLAWPVPRTSRSVRMCPPRSHLLSITDRGAGSPSACCSCSSPAGSRSGPSASNPISTTSATRPPRPNTSRAGQPGGRVPLGSDRSDQPGGHRCRRAALAGRR